MANTMKRLRDDLSYARSKRLERACLMAALLASAALALLGLTPTARLDAPDVYAIKDAQIITGSGKTIAKGTVVFRNGLITEVGENVRIPADARVINGAGMTVYPGLIDSYTSLGIPAPAQTQTPGGQGGGGRQAALAAAAAGQQPNPEQALGNPSTSAADLVRPGGTGVEDARSVGITSALTSPRQGLFAGQSAVINLAGSEASKMVLRSPVALTVQFTTGGGFFGQYPNSLMGTVAFIRQSFYDAMHYRDEVERFDRVKRGVERPAYDKKLAALQPALKGDMPVLFVANSEGDIRRSLMIADEFKLKPIIEGALYGYRMAAALKSKNVPVILSLDFPRRSADLPDDEDESLRVLRARAEAPKGAAMLAQAGIKFAFTSGSLRPAEFIANVQKAVENGLSKDEALRALTVNAAEILGASDQLGAIEVGKIANIVVTSGDLFARDTKVRHVFIDGSEVELKKPEAAPQRAFAGGRAGGPPAAAATGAVDATGEWTLRIRAPQGEINARLSLRKEGDQTLGTLNSPVGAAEIRNAKLTGNELKFSASMSMGGDTIEMTVTGAIEGDNMRGVIVAPPHGTFEFTGTRPR
jgi:imidazolonepropionase-like amidohydrolase